MRQYGRDFQCGSDSARLYQLCLRICESYCSVRWQNNKCYTPVLIRCVSLPYSKCCVLASVSHDSNGFRVIQRDSKWFHWFRASVRSFKPFGHVFIEASIYVYFKSCSKLYLYIMENCKKERCNEGNRLNQKEKWNMNWPKSVHRPSFSCWIFYSTIIRLGSLSDLRPFRDAAAGSVNSITPAIIISTRSQSRNRIFCAFVSILTLFSIITHVKEWAASTPSVLLYTACYNSKLAITLPWNTDILTFPSDCIKEDFVLSNKSDV